MSKKSRPLNGFLRQMAHGGLFLALVIALGFPNPVFALQDLPGSGGIEGIADAGPSSSPAQGRGAPPAERRGNLGLEGTGWIGTNGKVVIISHGFHMTVYRSEDPTTPVARDIDLGGGIEMGEMRGDLAFLVINRAHPGSDQFPMEGGAGPSAGRSVRPEGFINRSDLSVWDFSMPERPVEVDEFNPFGLPAYIMDFALSGDHIFFGGDLEGIAVVNRFGDGCIGPGNTFPLHRRGDQVNRMAIQGDWLLALTIDGTLISFDISNPQAPRRASMVDASALHASTSIHFVGQYLYFALGYQSNPGDAFTGTTCLAIYRLPDPADLSSIDFLHPENAQAPLSIPPALYDAVIQGSTMCAASVTPAASVIDIGDPSSPVLRCTYDTGFRKSGTLGMHLALSEERIYVSHGSAFTTLAADCQMICRTPRGSNWGGGWVYAKPLRINSLGNMGLINYPFEGFQLLDLEPSDLPRLGFWENPRWGGENEVVDSVMSPDDRAVFVAAADWADPGSPQGFLWVVDIRDPLNPRTHACLMAPTAGEEAWFPTDLTVSEDLFLAVILSEGRSGAYRIDFFDIAEPLAPVPLGSYRPSAPMAILGFAAFHLGGSRYGIASGMTAAGVPTLFTLDLSDLRSPRFLASYGIPNADYPGFILIREGMGGVTGIVCAGCTPLFAIRDPGRPDGLDWLSYGCWLKRYDTIVPVGDQNTSDVLIASIGYRPQDYCGPDFLGISEGQRLSQLGPPPSDLTVSWYATSFRQGGKDFVLANSYSMGVSVVEHVPDFEPPTVDLVVDPPIPDRLTGPFEVHLQGISDNQEVAKVSVSLITTPRDSDWAPTLSKFLGYATGPDADGGYHLTIDPGTIRYQGRALLAVNVVDRAWNLTGRFTRSFDLAARPDLSAACQASPTVGRAPLTVAFSASIAGGVPPYSFRWTFHDFEYSWATETTKTYRQPGGYSADFTVIDSLLQEAHATVSILVNHTYDPPRIDRVSKKKSPWRLLLQGASFQDGAQAFIGDSQVPVTTFKGATLLELGGGKVLKKMVPVGKFVAIQVRNPDGQASPLFFYRRG